MSSLPRGFCLSSQGIRKRLVEGFSFTKTSDLSRSASGIFQDSALEDRIQPSSRDTITSPEAFILDTEGNGLFKPSLGKSVYRSLLELPARQRQKIDLTGGFEFKAGFSYLVKLEDKEMVLQEQSIKSSPKSSLGRLFLNTRLLADHNPCFDQISPSYVTGQLLDLWLLVQPLCFNVLVHPELSLSQLRFLYGRNAKLSEEEILDQYSRAPILFEKNEDGEFTPSPPIMAVGEGLQIHLDARGRATNEIIGLRARKNPQVIDLHAKGKYVAEEYFEPMLKEKLRGIKPRNEHYLLSSREVFVTPPDLSVELKSTSHVGLTGPLHFAGFIDNGFSGDLVFEVRSDELTGIEITDGMPISTLDVFRTGEVPDKLYGGVIGSSYHQQKGPQPSKHFAKFDYADAARNYKKMARSALVQVAEDLLSLRSTPEGFELLSADGARSLEERISNGFFHSRYDCETDELVLQPIPYALLFGRGNTIFAYSRAENKVDYGDTRLFGKISIGVGGHINIEDAPDYVAKNLDRELHEEVTITGTLSPLVLAGTLVQRDKPVDRVHFGVIYVACTDGEILVKEAALKKGIMVPIDQVRDWAAHGMPTYAGIEHPELETWSRVLGAHLPALYAIACKKM